MRQQCGIGCSLNHSLVEANEENALKCVNMDQKLYVQLKIVVGHKKEKKVGLFDCSHIHALTVGGIPML
jgi:hypothetical protein